MPLPSLRLIRPSTRPVSQREERAPEPLAAQKPAEIDVESVFRMYAADVAARGLSMLGSPEEADDLVQDVFLRAFRAIGDLTDPAAVRPWLMTIAVREGLRRLKKRKLSRLWFGAHEIDFESLAASGAPQETKLQIGRLFRMLDRLPAELRVAWVLRYLECETTEAVAEACGWSLSTTKRRIAAAHERVMKEMA